jgi:hypothetical protein
VIEKLLDRRAEAAAGPEAAESAPELGEIPDQNGGVEGAAKRTSDEGGRGIGWGGNGLIHWRNFGDRDATI